MRVILRYLAGLVIASVLLPGPILACVVQGFDGQQPLAPWDARDTMARQIEADGVALGLSQMQVARLAWALRLGSAAAPALTAADQAALRAFDRACDPPAAPVAVVADPSFGFDLHLGWPQLLASATFAIVAIGGLLAAGHMRTAWRKRTKRYVCARFVQCRVVSDPVRVARLQDVSLSGARMSLRGAQPLVAGVNVVLDFGSFEMPGQVVRASHHVTAVDFDRPLSRAELLHLVRPEKYPTPVSLGTGPPAQT
jgi:hypothetical protein